MPILTIFPISINIVYTMSKRSFKNGEGRRGMERNKIKDFLNKNKMEISNFLDDGEIIGHDYLIYTIKNKLNSLSRDEVKVGLI